MTPLQIREKLAALAAQVIPNQIDQFKDLLALKGGPNSGVSVTDDLKYTSVSTCWPPSYHYVTAFAFQSDSRDRMEYMFLPPSSGMG
jgi:hypothetical protein